MFGDSDCKEYRTLKCETCKYYVQEEDESAILEDGGVGFCNRYRYYLVSVWQVILEGMMTTAKWVGVLLCSPILIPIWLIWRFVLKCQVWEHQLWRKRTWK